MGRTKRPVPAGSPQPGAPGRGARGMLRDGGCCGTGEPQPAPLPPAAGAGTERGRLPRGGAGCPPTHTHPTAGAGSSPRRRPSPRRSLQGVLSNNRDHHHHHFCWRLPELNSNRSGQVGLGASAIVIKEGKKEREKKQQTPTQKLLTRS